MIIIFERAQSRPEPSSPSQPSPALQIRAVIIRYYETATEKNISAKTRLAYKTFKTPKHQIILYYHYD